MKKISSNLINLIKNYSSSKFGWDKLKATRYIPNSDSKKTLFYRMRKDLNLSIQEKVMKL